MESIKTIFLDETNSTNAYLRDYQGEEGEALTVVWTDFQTAGRGQGTNSWESERAKNLTFSVKVHPKGVPAARQYVMLEAAALAVKTVLDGYADGITIKWPNDVYWNDRKISGTLSECSVHGACVRDCIIGTGINVNQRAFVSDAPNPVSLFNILGCETDRRQLLDTVAKRLVAYMERVNAGDYDDIHNEYKSNLYRRTGAFLYEDGEGAFAASIADVEENGHLVLRRSDGRLSTYAFKEVKFII